MSSTEFIVIIRPEFMRICKDACRAATLNHLLFRIAYKCKDQPKEKVQAGDILWYAKTELLAEEMSHAWGECKVRKEVNALIADGLIGRKSNPQWGADRTKHFCFGKKQCQKLLALCAEQNICLVHLDLPAEVKHLIYISNANHTSIKCICSIHQMETIDIADANDRCMTAITKNTYEDTYEEEESITSNITVSDHPQDATALATHTHENVIEVEMTSQSTKGRTQNENDSHSHDGSGNPARRLSATGRPGTQGATNGGEVSDAQPLCMVPPSSTQTPRTAGGTGDHPVLPQELTPPVVVESPLSPLVATPTSLDSITPVRTQRKPKAVKDATVAASPMPQCDVHELRRRINAHRGYALEEKIEIIRENQATKAWSALHTLDDYETVMRELACDPYWGKPENISRVGGVTLQKETPRLLAKVRTGNRQPATGSAYSAEIVTRFGTATSRAEFAAEFYPSEAERRMQYAAK